MKRFIILYFIIQSFNSSAQQIEWQNTIGGNYSDDFGKIIPTNDGGYLFGGSSLSDISGDVTDSSRGNRDFWFVKTDSLSNIQWQKKIGGNSSDMFSTMERTTDGGYIIAGSSSSDSSGEKTIYSFFGSEDYWVLKTDSNLNIQWQRCYGHQYHEYMSDAHQTRDGGYVFAGWAANSNGYVDVWIIKTDSIGNIQWESVLGGNENDDIPYIHQTSDDGFIIAATSNSDSAGEKSEDSRGLFDYWLVKLNSAGQVMWDKTIGGSDNDYVGALQITSDGGFILGGQSMSNISGEKSENSDGGGDYWIVKTDSLGTIQWQHTIGGSNYDYLQEIVLTNDGGFLVGGRSNSDSSADKSEDTYGSDDCWILKLDAIGNIQWQYDFGGTNLETTPILIEKSPGKYLAVSSSKSNISGNKTENSNGDYDSWVVSISDKNNLISGKMFADLNGNLIQDNGENGIMHHSINETTLGLVEYSQLNGGYYFNVSDTGNFGVTPSPLLHYTPVPVQRNVHFTSVQTSDTLNDFAFQPNGTINDLEITITPFTPFRVVRNSIFYIHYRNTGSTTLPGTIVLYLDADANFISSSTTPGIFTTDSIVWQIPSIAPFEEGDILVTVNTFQGNGNILISTVKIEPIAGDATPLNNTSVCRVPVIGSYDPNDIEVDRDTLSTIDLINDSYLDYTIRFQNTGTDTAFTVVVNNPLPVNADISSFEFIGSSHPVSINYRNVEKIIEFRFDNILLPDSNVDELLSHGFIRYRIKPFSTLVPGDSIANKVHIIFDLNAPVTTNTAITRIISPVGIEEPISKNDFTIYPNPANGDVTVSFNLKMKSDIHLDVYNLFGQKIKSFKSPSGKNEFRFSVSDLVNGIYYLSCSFENGRVVKKLLKTE